MPKILKACCILLLFVLPILASGNEHSIKSKSYIFLTFDDGPINATLDVLDVLKQEGIHATFFVNGNHLYGEGGEREDRAVDALRRIVSEGHVLGNHGYDHMRHNNESYNPAKLHVASYRDVDVDYGYFLLMNTLVVDDILGDLRFMPNNHMLTIGRLPYTNNWRIPKLSIDCPCCTVDRQEDVPENGACSISIQNQSVSALSSKLLSDRLYANGLLLFGWDVHWQPEDWSGSAPSETIAPVQKLLSLIDAARSGSNCATLEFQFDKSCQTPPREGKVVLLVHDFLFENSFRGRGGEMNLPKLRQLVTILKKRGYQFETLDKYSER